MPPPKDFRDYLSPQKTNKSVARKEKIIIQCYKYDNKIEIYKVAQVNCVGYFELLKNDDHRGKKFRIQVNG